MDIPGSQLWDNIVFFLIMALLIEIAVSAVFSVKYIDELLQGSLSKSVKNLLVLLVAIGLCAKIPQLRLFYKIRIGMPDLVHLILSALVLGRIANLYHDWFVYMKKRSKDMG